MRKLKLYLDTSIINFAFADDSPRERNITLKLFDEIDKYEAYISNVVIDEINRAGESKRKLLFDFMGKYVFVKNFRHVKRCLQS